jgi:phosphatidylinositol alpha-1,6-mannosyltransferase
VLLTVARLVPRKGHDTVIRALEKIVLASPETVYVIAGEGSERARLEALVAELGLAGNVRFAGLVPDTELADFYNLCDLFVHMNRNVNGDLEGFGIVFLEAAACGKPVIAGKSGGTYAAVADGGSGYLLEPEDHDALANTVLRLWSDPGEMRRLGEVGRARATEFDWDRSARKLLELNRRLADERDAPN